MNRTRPARLISRATLAAALILTSLVGAAPVGAVASDTDAVLVWNEQAILALANPLPTAVPPPPVPGAGQAPPVAALHLAMVQGAVYDAVNAIDGGHQPYLQGLPAAPASASKAAAVATAAHHLLVGLVPAIPQVVKDRLDTFYGNYLAEIPDGADETAGIAIGAAAASAMLAARVGDGRFVAHAFPVGEDAGEWRTTPPGFVNDPFAWVANVDPFTLTSDEQLRTEGPPALTSAQYTAEYNEVKTLGALNGSTRSAEQTLMAQYYSTNPAPYLNRAIREMPEVAALSTADQARLFAKTSIGAADAFIACWDNKEFYHFWRPITAIQDGELDGNPDTAQDNGWLPFFVNPPYPDVPSGFNCYSSSVTRSIRAFFGTDHLSITLKNPAFADPRLYSRLSDIVRDTIDARVYMGIHFRFADVQGAWIGKKVAQWIDRNYFQPVE